MRGIRGATTVAENTADEIKTAAKELVKEICQRNNLSPEQIGAVIFSATPDITAAFPATGARQLDGFALVPLFDTCQMDVENALPLCIRVLILADTDEKQKDIRHVFLNGAANLRPDLSREELGVRS